MLLRYTIHAASAELLIVTDCFTDLGLSELERAVATVSKRGPKSRLKTPVLTPTPFRTPRLFAPPRSRPWWWRVLLLVRRHSCAITPPSGLPDAPNPLTFPNPRSRRRAEDAQVMLFAVGRDASCCWRYSSFCQVFMRSCALGSAMGAARRLSAGHKASGE